MANNLYSYWRLSVVVLTPLVLYPITCCFPAADTAMVNCAFVVVLMAIFWMTEVIPIAATALVPLFALPLLGVAPAKTVAASYVKDVSFLFIGGLLVAVAVEQTDLHRRIALLVLRAMGSQPRSLMLGVMTSTALLSMFISNTATTAMMVPIVLTLCREMIESNRSEPSHNVAMTTNVGSIHPLADVADTLTPAPVVLSRETLSSSELRLCKAMLLATCYAASLGGTATLTGTPPNVIMAGMLTDRYGEHPVNYFTWMCYNGPGMILNIAIAWVWLQVALLGWRCTVAPRNQGGKPDSTSEVIRAQYRALGAVSWAQLSVLSIFLLLFVFWITRSPLWGGWFKHGTSSSFATDATAAMFFACVLFVWPKHSPFATPLPPYEPVLSWRTAQKGVAWGVVLLLGGGFALGDAVSATGLSRLIGEALFGLPVSRVGLCVVSLAVMTCATELTSNTATASILLPIMMELAERRCVNPLYLTLPVTEAASFAFMLPVATPPNAIVFGAGLLRVSDMMALGVVMNVVCMLEVLLSIHTWGWAIFGLAQFPQWAGNFTDCT